MQVLVWRKGLHRHDPPAIWVYSLESAWRDTKLAIVMFVREKNLTAVVEKARAALEQHPQLVERRQAANETELRATMSWPGDDRRHADLNIFFIHTPL